VTVSLEFVTDPAETCNISTATYQSAPFDTMGCQTVPVTLTKVSETPAGSSYICGGSLPDTITLDSAA
jgi:hypothetical protein